MANVLVLFLKMAKKKLPKNHNFLGNLANLTICISIDGKKSLKITICHLVFYSHFMKEKFLKVVKFGHNINFQCLLQWLFFAIFQNKTNKISHNESGKQMAVQLLLWSCC
jgi:hypothetical protein